MRLMTLFVAVSVIATINERRGFLMVGLALLIIVAASVIGLICINKKRKDLEEDEGFTATTDTSGTSSSTSTATNTHQEEEKTSGPPQNTIYEFLSKAGKRLCPFCDGENSAGAKVCNICGRDI